MESKMENVEEFLANKTEKIRESVYEFSRRTCGKTTQC